MVGKFSGFTCHLHLQSQALTLSMKKHYYYFICRLAPCQNVPSALHFHLHTGSVMPETPVRGKFWEVSGDSEVKEPERGGVGWFRVCAPVRSSPGGRKALCRVDFLPAGNPAHSLHPPPLTSRADAVRAEFRKPRVPYAGGVAYKQDPARGRSAW